MYTSMFFIHPSLCHPNFAYIMGKELLCMHVCGTAHMGIYACHEDNMYKQWLCDGWWGYESNLQDVMISLLGSRKLQNKAKDIEILSISSPTNQIDLASIWLARSPDWECLK